MFKKKRLLVVVTMILAFVLIIAGCSSGNNEGTTPAAPTAPTTPSNTDSGTEAAPDNDAVAEESLSGEINIWTWNTSVLEPYLPAFKELHPDLTVNVLLVPDSQGAARTAIAAGAGGPDIFAIEQGNVKSFSNMAGVEDLLQAPYNAGEIIGDIIGPHVDRFRSLDGSKVIAMPMDAPPGAMFYRQDIMEQFGYPTEPEELAVYLESEENLINMALAFQAQDKFFIPAQGLHAYALQTGGGFFDTDLNFVRNNEKYVRDLELSKKVKQLGLAVPHSIWTKDGQAMIASGDMPIIISGSWLAGPTFLPTWAAGQEGLWKATRLPLGQYSGFGGAGLAITSQSQNKEAAWAFVKFATASVEGWEQVIPLPSLPGYKPAWEVAAIQDEVHPFLQQHANRLFVDLIDRIPEFPLSNPLDDKAKPIFDRLYKEAIDNNLDAVATLQKIEEDVMNAVSADRDILLRTLGKK